MRAVALTALIVSAMAGCDGTGAVSFPASSDGAPGVARLTANDRCERCHSQIAAEWRTSRHRAAFTNDAFGRAYALEPDPFCSGCHAPEAKELDAPALAEAGVACVTCHLDADGAVLAADTSSDEAPHALRRTAAFARPDACARCHEFAFPSPLRDREEMMQTTVREHAASPFANVSCAGCHMPPGEIGGHRSHAFASSRSNEAIERALRVQTTRSDGAVTLSISTEHVGHAFPTGDLFRRLRLTAEATDSEGTERRVQDYLARHFKSRRGSSGRWFRTEVDDDRPGGRRHPDGSTTTVLDLGPFARTLPIRWQVAYERVDHLDRDSEDGASVADSVLIAGGTLPP